MDVQAVTVVIDEAQRGRNLFMKWLTRERVVPIISASVSWLIFAMTGSGLSFLAEIREQQENARQALLAGVEELIDQVRFDPRIPRQKMGDEQLGERGFVMKDLDHHRPFPTGQSYIPRAQ